MIHESQRRLKWACRRGMLELDLLLQPFAEKKFPFLSADEQQDFQRLLACNDQLLYDWLVKQMQPDDASLIEIVQRVRQRA